MNIRHLIIFCENAVQGEVKKRLASEVGEENALVVYEELLSHTADVSKSVMAQRKCYYSQFVANDDFFDDGHFEKLIQKGGDIGEVMYNACKLSFGEWANKVVMVGSSCYDLNAGIIEEAFRALDNHDFVIGPSKDGGFYLLGLNDLYPELFLDRHWDNENVILDTIIEIGKLNKTHYILPTLTLVESIDDVPDHIKDLLEE